MAWTVIPEIEAKKHELYGVGGWLLLFAILLPVSLLAFWGTLAGEARSLGVGVGDLLAVDHPAITHIKISLGVQTALVIVVSWLIVQKSSAFRVVTTWLLLSYYPVVVLVGMANPFDGQVQGLVQAGIGWVVSCAIWVTYLQRSRRVRITFEQMVRLADPDAPASTAVVSPSTGSAAHPPMAEPPSAAVAPQVAAPVAASSFASMDSPSEEYWAQALQEVEGADRRPGLWARAFAHAKGVEAVAKANYLEFRVQELQQEHQAQLADETEQLRQQAEEARIAALPEERRAFERLPKGTCPNCSTLQPLASLECPKCKAVFGPDSAWTLIPAGSAASVSAVA